MQKADGGVRSQTLDRNDSLGSIASSLESLIAQVRAGIKVIETAIDHEAGGDQEEAAGIFVLDDVMPRYANANAALHACEARLGDALKFLRDDTTSTARVETGSRVVRLIARG
jgi:hypothetical protein